MNIRYLKSSTYRQALKSLNNRSLDIIIVAGSHIVATDGGERLKETLDECVRVLKDTGILFIHGTPFNLPSRIEPLMRSLQFKYWIAIESAIVRNKRGLPSTHAAVAVFAKSKKSFPINKVRFPHHYCSFCNRTLKDWGGKAHLMNPAGYALSDVWRDLPHHDNYKKLSLPVLETLLRLIDAEDTRCLIFPYEGIDFDPNRRSRQPRLLRNHSAPSPVAHGARKSNPINDSLLDVVLCGNAAEVLSDYPDGSVDLAFADPPYNLAKSYSSYQDVKDDEAYVQWCNSWLKEYIRVLKPTGSLYIVNLPKWAIHHAAFLNNHLHLQNWIAWDAISEPRGKIMPAHYALLFYTKQPTDFTFNYEAVSPVDAPSFCLRGSCLRERTAQGIVPKVPLTDIWWDIHRIRHRRDRDMHPCQLPEKFMERIVRLSSNKGDVVLDALCGAGTTAVAASTLQRRFIAIDVDPFYTEMTRAKIGQLRSLGSIPKKRQRRPPQNVTKKELQLELTRLARSLGRLPTEDDVRKMSKYDLELFHIAFSTWGKALKAAKLEMPQ
jgi:site-specific DNA-methyltransferase (adenine-specific)